METKIILPDDNASASYQKNIKGWVSRDGYFYGKDEQAARWADATHKKCEKCEEVYTKNSYCRKFYKQKENDNYEKMEKKWDEEGMVYSQVCDRYFNDWDEIDDFCKQDCCEEEGCRRENLQLIICEPVYTKELETDYWND